MGCRLFEKVSRLLLTMRGRSRMQRRRAAILIFDGRRGRDCEKACRLGLLLRRLPNGGRVRHSSVSSRHLVEHQAELLRYRGLTSFSTQLGDAECRVPSFRVDGSVPVPLEHRAGSHREALRGPVEDDDSTLVPRHQGEGGTKCWKRCGMQQKRPWIPLGSSAETDCETQLVGPPTAAAGRGFDVLPWCSTDPLGPEAARGQRTEKPRLSVGHHSAAIY